MDPDFFPTCLGKYSNDNFILTQSHQCSSIFVLESSICGPHLDFLALLQAQRILLINFALSFREIRLKNMLHRFHAFQRHRFRYRGLRLVNSGRKALDPRMRSRIVRVAEHLLWKRTFKTEQPVERPDSLETGNA